MPATPHPLLRQLAWAWLAQAIATLLLMAMLAPLGGLIQDIAAEAIARGARADVRAIEVIAQGLRGISWAFGVVALAGFAGALALWRQRSRDLVQVACVPMLAAVPPLGLGLAILTWWLLRRPDVAAALRDAAAPVPLGEAPAAAASPPAPAPSATDLAHLRQLAIGHWAMAALQLLPLGIMALQALMLGVVFGQAGQPGGPPPLPDGVHLLFAAGWTWMGVMVAITAALNIAAARALGRGRGLALVQATAAVNALQFPIGLALAIPTVLVTQRPAVAAALAAGLDADAPRG